MRPACLRRRRRFRRCRPAPTKRCGSRSPTTPTWSRSAARRSPPAMTSMSPGPAACRRCPAVDAATTSTISPATIRRVPEHRQRDDGRPQRAHSDLPGRASRGADPPGAGAAGPGARAGRRHRARRRPGRPRGLRQLRRVAARDPGANGRRPGQPACARRQPRRAERRHPHDHRSAERRAGTAELAGRAGDRQARRLCRGLPAAERDGPGRSRRTSGSMAARFTIRSAITAASPTTGTTGRATRAIRPSRPGPSRPRRCRRTRS